MGPQRLEIGETKGPTSVGRGRGRGVFSVRALLAVWLPLFGITILHYASPRSAAWIHHVARRLYYVPIIIAAFQYGLVGGLWVAASVCVLYIPHAFLLHEMRDPAVHLEKLLEMVIYGVVAVVAGYLADKAHRRRTALSQSLVQQKRLVHELARAERLSALGEVVAGIAHEIKNPLHSLKGTAEIVDPLIDHDIEERRIWELHLSELDRLQRTAQRFLSFARPEEYSRQKLDLNDVARRLLELVGAEARQRAVELESVFPDTELPVRGDSDGLAQVGLNIVLNALHAIERRHGTGNEDEDEDEDKDKDKDKDKDSPPGRIKLSLGRKIQAEQRWAFMRLENNGPPIPDADLEKIFDPFHSGRQQSSGLGLSISARIVEQHGGYLEVKNEGLGVMFTVLLPEDHAKQ